MKRVLFLCGFLCLVVRAFAQLETDNSLAFQEVIDSVICRSAKSGVKEVKIAVTPYEMNPTAKPGDSLHWTALNKDNSDVYFPEQFRWTFLNDSVAKFRSDNNTTYALVRGKRLYEYDPGKKAIVYDGKSATHDSTGYTIIETWRKISFKQAVYMKSVYDNNGNRVQCYQSRTGEDAYPWSAGAVYYISYAYPPDTVSKTNVYWLHHPDSAHYVIASFVNGKRTMRDSVAYEPVGDTLLTMQYSIVQAFAPDHSWSKDTIVTCYFDKKGNCTRRNVNATYTTYVYDAKNRLVGAASESWTPELGKYFRWEMEIVYE